MERTKVAATSRMRAREKYRLMFMVPAQSADTPLPEERVPMQEALESSDG